MLCVQTFMFWLQPELPMTHKRGSAAPQRRDNAHGPFGGRRSR
jgi:hypothetical protein